MRLFRRAFRRPQPPREPLSDEAMARLLLLADLSPSPLAPGHPVRDPLPRPLSDHCRPGRCMGLTCCSYECSQGRCPSIPAEFREPTP